MYPTFFISSTEGCGKKNRLIERFAFWKRTSSRIICRTGAATRCPATTNSRPRARFAPSTFRNSWALAPSAEPTATTATLPASSSSSTRFLFLTYSYILHSRLSNRNLRSLRYISISTLSTAHVANLNQFVDHRLEARLLQRPEGSSQRHAGGLESAHREAASGKSKPARASKF